MTLTDFISALINKGEVSVAPTIVAFKDDDIRLAQVHLQQYYDDDSTEMPGQAPAYDPGAAFWAARYLYRAIQFILLRHLGEADIRTHLLPFTGTLTSEAMYAADLTLRYLPDLFHHAKGRSPEDPLVKELELTAIRWPLSAAAIASAVPEDLSLILQHPSLRLAYVDRIIRAKDMTKCSHPECLPFVQAALGTHASALWPQFETDLTFHV